MHYLWRELPQSRSIIDGSLRLPLGGSKGSSSSSSLKRKANEECKNCGFLYAVDENKHGKCRYHCGEFLFGLSTCICVLVVVRLPFNSPCLLGEQEVDEDSKVWASYNPERDGEKLGDSLVNNDFYADGYVMKCCERRPYEPGCVISRHKPFDPERPKKVKRGLDIAGLW
jgi:hypothetical protein